MTHVPAPESTPEASQPESGPVSDRDAQDAREAISERCGFTVIEDGDEEPCDRPAPSWRWYQGHFHEDTLDHACELHENEGGRRMATLVARVAELEAERDRFRRAALLACSALDVHPDHADTCSHALNPEYACTCWRREVYAASVDAALAAAGPVVLDGDVEGYPAGFVAHAGRIMDAAVKAAVSDGEGATSEACPTCGSTGDRTTFTDGTACHDNPYRPASPVVAPSATDEGPVCAKDVGDPPEVCRCLLPRGHAGLHQCKHKNPAPDAVPSGEATDGTTPTKEA